MVVEVIQRQISAQHKEKLSNHENSLEYVMDYPFPFFLNYYTEKPTIRFSGKPLSGYYVKEGTFSTELLCCATCPTDHG